MTISRIRPPVLYVLEQIATQCLDETSENYDVSVISSHVERLMATIGNEDICEVVAEAVREGIVSLEHGGTIIGVASWSGSENGASAQKTLENWLRNSEDPIEVGLALAQNVSPFSSAAECYSVLEEVARRFPGYEERCAELISWRRTSEERKARAP